MAARTRLGLQNGPGRREAFRNGYEEGYSAGYDARQKQINDLIDQANEAKRDEYRPIY